MIGSCGEFRAPVPHLAAKFPFCDCDSDPAPDWWTPVIGFRANGRSVRWRRRSAGIGPDEFKRQAAERVETSGLSVMDVAAELGVHETQLRRWIFLFFDSSGKAGTGSARRPITQALSPFPCRLGDGECPSEAGAAKGPDGARHLKKGPALIFGAGHPLSAIAGQSPAGQWMSFGFVG